MNTTVTKTHERQPTKCPICDGNLCVDVEYMLDTFGPAYEYMSWKLWSYYCDDCEEAGIWNELTNMAKDRK